MLCAQTQNYRQLRHETQFGQPIRDLLPRYSND